MDCRTINVLCEKGCYGFIEFMDVGLEHTSYS